MKVNEIRKMVEQIVGTEYVAEDGAVFHNEEECRKYEESALFAVSSKLRRLHTKALSAYDFLDEGCEDCSVEIFDVQTDADLENLRRYLYLKAKENGAIENHIQSAFTSEDGERKDFVFDGVTSGHEVIIFWGYDQDWFWVYRDGSIEGYLGFLRDKWTKLIVPETMENRDMFK